MIFVLPELAKITQTKNNALSMPYEVNILKKMSSLFLQGSRL